MACLPRLEQWVRRFLIVLSVAVTVFGLAWLSVRSHDVAQAADVLEGRPEAGADPAPGLHRPRVRRHLRPQELAVDRRRRRSPVRGAGRGRVGGRPFALVDAKTDRDPLQFDGWTRGSSEIVHTDFSDFRVTTYTRTDA